MRTPCCLFAILLFATTTLAQKEKLSLKGHTGQVPSVAWSPPDGKRLATAGDDVAIHVWDVATGQQLLTLRGHTGTVESIAFSPDGKRLVSAGGDGTVRVWDAASGKEVVQLKHEAQSTVH